MLLFLMMLWHTPVVQNTAQCWGLAKWVHITTGCICLFIGIGFPAFIVWKTRKLKNADKLHAGSSFAPLYENYNPSMPYFEAIHFLRKALLIVGMTVPSFFRSKLARAGVNASIVQALTSLLINTGFFAIVWKTKPLVYFPCIFLENQNVNNLAGLVGAGATIAGNLLALIGSFSPYNTVIVNVLGILFTTINVCFLSIFFYGFYVDMKKSNEQKQSLLLRNSQASFEDGTATSFTRDASLSQKLATSVITAEKDFDSALLSLAMVEGRAKGQVIAELPYIRSQITLALKKELG